MNLASQSGERQTDLLFVNFNQDYSSLSVGTKTGYKIYSLSSQDKLECIYENVSENNIIVERLFASSLLAVVSLAAPRKLKVNHFKKGTEICNYSYSNSILAVKLNRQRLVVCLEESLYIHSIRDMKVMHTIRDTPPNTKGLCALASCSDNSYLAYPGSNTTGEVQIFDTISLRAVTIIPAHQSPLAALSFSHDGLKLATASEKGTVIRIYSIPDGTKIFEFRRGVKRNVTINSMSFSSCGNFLSASSNTETVHVFKLEVVKDKPVEEPQSWMGWMGAALKSSAHYLPQGVSEVFNQGRSFAVARLPTSGFKNICALQMQGKVPRLYVASEDGFFYSFNFDPAEGGELTLNKQLRLDGQGDEAAAGSESPPQERPLASQPTPATYAATARRGEPTAAPAPESHAYQELEGAMSSSPDLMSRELGSLQLDNVAEFPPVGHKTE